MADDPIPTQMVEAITCRHCRHLCPILEAEVGTCGEVICAKHTRANGVFAISGCRYCNQLSCTYEPFASPYLYPVTNRTPPKGPVIHKRAKRGGGNQVTIVVGMEGGMKENVVLDKIALTDNSEYWKMMLSNKEIYAFKEAKENLAVLDICTPEDFSYVREFLTYGELSEVVDFFEEFGKWKEEYDRVKTEERLEKMQAGRVAMQAASQQIATNQGPAMGGLQMMGGVLGNAPAATMAMMPVANMGHITNPASASTSSTNPLAPLPTATDPEQTTPKPPSPATIADVFHTLLALWPLAEYLQFTSLMDYCVHNLVLITDTFSLLPRRFRPRISISKLGAAAYQAPLGSGLRLFVSDFVLRWADVRNPWKLERAFGVEALGELMRRAVELGREMERARDVKRVKGPLMDVRVYYYRDGSAAAAMYKPNRPVNPQREARRAATKTAATSAMPMVIDDDDEESGLSDSAGVVSDDEDAGIDTDELDTRKEAVLAQKLRLFEVSKEEFQIKMEAEKNAFKAKMEAELQQLKDQKAQLERERAVFQAAARKQGTSRGGREGRKKRALPTEENDLDALLENYSDLYGKGGKDFVTPKNPQMMGSGPAETEGVKRQRTSLNGGQADQQIMAEADRLLRFDDEDGLMD